MESYELDEMMVLAIAQLFEVPEILVAENPNWGIEQLTALLLRTDISEFLKGWMKDIDWKRKQGWYGKVEEENE